MRDDSVRRRNRRSIAITNARLVVRLLGDAAFEFDGKPWKLERWAARTSLRVTLERDAPKGAPQIPLNDENLIAGIRLYGQNCAVCHGASDAKPSRIARGLYQTPPQLAKDGVEDDPEGVTYWKIDHGIRFTGMPAFGKTLDDTQVWQLVLFLKHMDALPPAPEQIWKSLRLNEGKV